MNQLEKFSPVGWKIRDAVYIFLIVLFATTTLANLIAGTATDIEQFSGKDFFSPQTLQGKVIIFFYSVMLLLFTTAFVLRRNEGRVPNFWFRAEGAAREIWYGFKAYFLVLLLSMLLVFLIVLGIILVTAILGQDTEKVLQAYSAGRIEETKEVMGAGFSWFTLFFLAVMAPVVEEIFFRGFLYAALRRKFRVRMAIVISAVAFAIVHGYFFNFFNILLLGFICAYVYERRGSLISAMVLHFLWNASCYFLTLG